VAPRLAEALGIVLGTEEIPLRLRAWDGSEAGPSGAPVIEFRSRRGLRRMLWAPNQLGLSRAYVAGDIDGPDDLFESFSALSSVGKFAEVKAFRPPTWGERSTLLRTAVRVGALGLPPAPPREEMNVTRVGRKHSKKA
jgi:cyclopropane-fatty-acyl-phospholipid synthase